jgi:hypothetical protein
LRVFRYCFEATTDPTPTFSTGWIVFGAERKEAYAMLLLAVPQKESVTPIVAAVAQRRGKVLAPLLFTSLLSTLRGVKHSYQKQHGYHGTAHSCAVDEQRHGIYTHQVSSVLSTPSSFKTERRSRRGRGPRRILLTTIMYLPIQERKLILVAVAGGFIT